MPRIQGTATASVRVRQPPAGTQFSPATKKAIGKACMTIGGSRPLAGSIIECKAPGGLKTEPTLLSYRMLRRPMVPLNPATLLVPQLVGTFTRTPAPRR